MERLFKDEFNEVINKYKAVFRESEIAAGYSQIKGIIKNALDSFIENHRQVAIYCFGEHTQFLLTEFIYELRSVKYIIDNGTIEDNMGYTIISESLIEESGIDGVIISTFRYRDEIINRMKTIHSSIDYIDFYEIFAINGIKIDVPFYRFDSPFSRYEAICNNYSGINGDQISNRIVILENCISIKDFKLIIKFAEELYDLTGDNLWKEIACDFKRLHISFFEHLRKLDNTILLLCMDAMRYASLLELKKTYPILKENGKEFLNFYSYSTSTFESLYPVYLETTDQKSKYYDSNSIEVDKCRFTKTAIENGRNIYVIGDGFAYFKGEHVKEDKQWSTLTQKLFTFLNWAELDPTGVFWVQPAYESHVSFISPYCKSPLLIHSSNIFFEYNDENDILDKRYSDQYHASIRYIDDVLCDFIKNIRCKLLFFSDHGDHNFDKLCITKAKNIKPISFTAKEDNIRIPFVIISPDEEAGTCETGLHSLMELNDIVCSMINNRSWAHKDNDFIKIGRTALYNPRLKKIINTVFNQKHVALAFEGFIFKDGYKLIVYEDGKVELYSITNEDHIIEDEELIMFYFNRVKGLLSVLEVE